MPDKLFHKLTDQYTGKIYQYTWRASILILLVMSVYRLFLIFTYNGEIGGIDNNFVYAVIRGMAGYSMYPDPSSMPYATNLYSPLYFNLCVFWGNIFSISIEEPIQVYRLCRSISFLCDIGTVLIFFQILGRNTSLRKEIKLLATSGFVILLCYLGYTFSRADSLFLFFYALVFYVLLSANIQKNNSSIFLLALLTIACIYSKQNGIILPLLTTTWLFINESIKKSFIYVVSFALLFLGTFILYKYVLGYTFIINHTIDALKNKIDLSWFYVYVFKRFSDSLLLLPIYIAIGISLMRLKKGMKKEKSLGIIFLLQTLFSLGASFKFGASAGYFNESFFLGLIIICQHLSAFNNPTQNVYFRKILAWTLPLILLFTFHVSAQGYLFFLQKQKEKKDVYTAQLAIRDYLQPKLNGKMLLNLGNQNGDFFKTIFYKEAAVPNYDQVNCCTLPDDIFDYSKLLKDLQNGEIKYLLMSETDMLTEIWGISLQNYYKDTILSGHVIFKFREDE